MFLSTIKNLLRPIRDRVDRWALVVCERFPYLSNLYYCVSRDFELEHLAVVVGRRRYLESVRGASDLGHVYRLRRNIHRLEKGLIFKPRRDVFAADYIAETITSFSRLFSSEKCGQQKELYEWAQSVLDSYFEAVKEGLNTEIDTQRKIFTQILSAQPCETTGLSDSIKKAPYVRDTTPLKTTVDDLLTLAKRRRSVRWYNAEPVPREAIDKAITIAGYSPSACNRQPFEFRIFDDPQMVSELAETPMGTRGFNHQFPVFVVIVGKLHAYPFARDRHVIYIDASLAAMALQYALEVQGIASCSINWPDISSREKKMAKLLGLEADERVVMCLSLGYPDATGMVPYSQKKPLDELRSYNQMSQR